MIDDQEIIDNQAYIRVLNLNNEMLSKTIDQRDEVIKKQSIIISELSQKVNELISLQPDKTI